MQDGSSISIGLSELRAASRRGGPEDTGDFVYILQKVGFKMYARTKLNACLVQVWILTLALASFLLIVLRDSRSTLGVDSYEQNGWPQINWK